MFAHLLRIVVALKLAIGVAVLAIVIDTAVLDIIGWGAEHSEGPFSPVIELTDSIVVWIVPIFLVGLAVWVLIGQLQQTRREEERRRVP